MNIRPLSDCIQIPLDEEYNKIIIYYYTDAPTKPYDAFIRKKYNIENEIPLYICMELWKLDGTEYIKEESMERVLEVEETKALIKLYLRFMVPTHEWDFSYKTSYEKYKNYRHSLHYSSSLSYYNLGNGTRWNRSWEISGDSMDSSGDDAVTSQFGPIY